jgi:hypothetical protein
MNCGLRQSLDMLAMKILLCRKIILNGMAINSAVQHYVLHWQTSIVRTSIL